MGPEYHRRVFLATARDIAEGKCGTPYSCLAVGRKSARAREVYERIFFDGVPDANPDLIAQAVGFPPYTHGFLKPTPKMVNFRVLLLCLAAACYEEFLD